MLSISEMNETITLSDVTEHDEAGFVKKYRQLWSADQYEEKMIESFPKQIEGKGQQIQFAVIIQELQDSKLERLEQIFKDKNVNVEKRIKKLKEKFTEKELLEKAGNIHVTSLTEIREVDGRFEWITISTHEVDDLLMEYSSLMSDKVKNMEMLIKDKSSLESMKKREVETNFNNQKTKRDLKVIEGFFEARGQDINKLLDEQATNRPKNKVAEKL